MVFLVFYVDSKLLSRVEALAKAFEARKTYDLKRLGEDSIKESVLENNIHLASISVIAYALYKIVSKEHFTSDSRWKTVNEIILKSLRESKEAVEKNDFHLLEKRLNIIVKEIQVIDDQLSNYARNVFEKAKIKQASTAYALGLSIGKSAELTGADYKDLQKYIGITRIHDEHITRFSMKERLKTLKGLLQ